MARHADIQTVDSGELRRVLGAETAQLIGSIAELAQAQGLALYLVGGVARDLLLSQPNQDLDFVLESDSVRFANYLAARYGGKVLAHKPFGTAIWTLDDGVASSLNVAARAIPQHIDFARARSETYSRPGALPTVSPADISADLRRRDFTLNTLALQLSPASATGLLLDECGGLNDLRAGLIRVLHERSFIDDPTRILRAVRLGARLGFDIETRTKDLLRAALPLLGGVTGARLVNEFDHILREPKAGPILFQLQALGALASIQPAFRVSADMPSLLARFHETEPPWQAPVDKRAVLWTLLLSSVSEVDAQSICQRLGLSQKLRQAAESCASLMANAAVLRDPGASPSQVARLLERTPEAALRAAWALLADSPTARNNLASFAARWRHQRPGISGADLLNKGLPPGPRYKQILDALRDAWIDGKLDSPETEANFLRELLRNED